MDKDSFLGGKILDITMVCGPPSITLLHKTLFFCIEFLPLDRLYIYFFLFGSHNNEDREKKAGNH